MQALSDLTTPTSPTSARIVQLLITSTTSSSPSCDMQETHYARAICDLALGNSRTSAWQCPGAPTTTPSSSELPAIDLHRANRCTQLHDGIQTSQDYWRVMSV